MYLNDLSDLEDILADIVPENSDELRFLTDSEETEYVNTCLQLMYDYINENPCAVSEPDFEETLIDNIKEIYELQFANTNLLMNDDDQEDMNENLEVALSLFYTQLFPKRSYPNTFIMKSLSKLEHETITNKIEYLRRKPQPEQRTPAWYIFRHSLITASNAYKAFENETTRNQLIFEKCQSLKIEEAISEKPAYVNITSPFHWGQKYEPVSVMFYENKYKTTVGDFGCIQHDKYPFLGASPDGINVNPTDPRFGRLLEIKNIVNREIDGIPKKEYWIQMQLQMETCDLDECDFLECRFSEYENETAFYADGTFSVTCEGEVKGVILYFSNKDGNPKYVYMPFHITEKSEFDKWEQEMMNLHDKSLTWIKNIYWRLDEYSCVLVLRNTKWFQDTVGELANTWNIIEQERNSGFQHRAAAKRNKKTVDMKVDDTPSGCFLSIRKLDGKMTIRDSATNMSLPTPIIKIRTESFDEAKKIESIN